MTQKFTVEIRKSECGLKYHAWCLPLNINANFHHHSLDYFLKEIENPKIDVKFI